MRRECPSGEFSGDRLHRPDLAVTRSHGGLNAPFWLAVQCPHLALDLITRGQAPAKAAAIAVSDGDPCRPRILDCNPAARRAGVHPGLPVSAALGLAEKLRLTTRHPQAERAALERLAARCYEYSSQVVPLSGSSELLLEIGGSRRLFGSTDELSVRLEHDLQRMGYHLRTGTAPTPEAARLAARHRLRIEPDVSLRARLHDLPLDGLALDPVQRTALEKMGFRSIGEILRLPRKALGRRLGPAVADYLDRLVGAQPDPRRSWQPPETFSSELELATEIAHSQALLFPLRRLVTELCGILRARDRGIQRLGLGLRHEYGRESLQLGLQQPCRDEERILLLLRERLERLNLPGPVRCLYLDADRLLPYDALQEGLFQEHTEPGLASIAPLLERLQARLGEQAVVGLKGVQDHRPEHSWAVRGLEEPAVCSPLPHRPVWLFARPQRCRIADYRLLAGPERIETGWWDGHDCRRDYFVVRDERGRRLWAFHEYKPNPGWYLQGLFA